ncbi:NAD(P)-binding domain-containing protein [Streptomyces litmocidini]|uniref:NAD(P)-binding domain-containing protein n=1 Tax=Streptomyces litmocidini TaxID=67318 RepID=UPI0036F6B935
MPHEETEVVVVGAGQAGVAMSEHLGAHGIPHLVLERHRIAERWRSERWDSPVANGPARHDRFPGLEFADIAPDGFASKEQVADYFVAYAEKIGAPVHSGVEVTSVRRLTGRPGFRVETPEGTIDARFVVAATGAFQRPVIPPVVPDGAVPAPRRLLVRPLPRDPGSVLRHRVRLRRRPGHVPRCVRGVHPRHGGPPAPGRSPRPADRPEGGRGAGRRRRSRGLGLAFGSGPGRIPTTPIAFRCSVIASI